MLGFISYPSWSLHYVIVQQLSHVIARIPNIPEQRCVCNVAKIDHVHHHIGRYYWAQRDILFKNVLVQYSTCALYLIELVKGMTWKGQEKTTRSKKTKVRQKLPFQLVAPESFQFCCFNCQNCTIIPYIIRRMVSVSDWVWSRFC